jgi:hypothetical protein
MSTMSAVVLQRVGPPEALQIRNLTISVLTPPGQVLIQIASFGLKWSEVRVRVGLLRFPRVRRSRPPSRNPLAPPGALRAMLANESAIRDSALSRTSRAASALSTASEN